MHWSALVHKAVESRGWTPRSTIGVVLYVALFCALAAWIYRLAQVDGTDEEAKTKDSK